MTEIKHTTEIGFFGLKWRLTLETEIPPDYMEDRTIELIRKESETLLKTGAFLSIRCAMKDPVTTYAFQYAGATAHININLDKEQADEFIALLLKEDILKAKIQF